MGSVLGAVGSVVGAATGVPGGAQIGGAIGNVAGSAISAGGAHDAAQTQANASNNSIAYQQHMFDTTQANLQPYMGIGKQAVNALTSATGLDGTNPLGSALLKPITMDEATLRQTPGYQFNLQQGLKAAQNSAAQRGLGVSGAAMKGASTYATGLADSTYQNQFNNAVTNQTNQFNRLNTILAGGQNAAAGLGGIGQQTGANIGSTIAGAGNAIAGSQIAGANAWGSGIQGAANTYGAASNAGLYGNSSNSNSGFTAAPSGSLYGDNGFYNTNTYNPAAAANGLEWSDRILKKNIQQIGEENGYPLYEFEYNWSPVKRIGVMAQDVLKKMPDAVEKVGSFLTVNYDKIGVQKGRTV